MNKDPIGNPRDSLIMIGLGGGMIFLLPYISVLLGFGPIIIKFLEG